MISAGNEGTMVSSPANCPGVAAVAAIRHAGSKVGFSSLGPEVTIAAPGGNCVNINGGPCLFSLDTTSNSGTTVPATNNFTDQINSNLGTSFSAPIVSGITALMLSRNANLSTAQMLARLREGARAFPASVADDPTIQACHVPVNDQDFQLAQCLCTIDTCGAGMANAAGSVAAAERPIAAVALPTIRRRRTERFVERVGQRRRLRTNPRDLRVDGGGAHHQSTVHHRREHLDRHGHRPDLRLDHGSCDSDR